jgi:hypothetical protein
LTAILTILLLAITPVWAETSGNWLDDGNYSLDFAGGDGSAADPFQIADAAQLARLAYLVNNEEDNAAYGDKYYKLTANINLSAHEWTPIGRWLEDTHGNVLYTKAFRGTFDGGNHIIDGLCINVTSGGCYGLFGVVREATVQNVNLTNAAITGSGYQVGALVGYNGYHSTVLNCSATGNVSASGLTVGGLVGSNYYGTVEDSSAAVEVNGGMYVGGLVGNGNGHTVRNCSATGDVHGSDYVGGLVGSQLFTNTVENCRADGNVSGTNYIGGLVGSNSNGTSSYASKVINCESRGDVSGTSDVGGLVGNNGRIAGGTVSDCVSYGDVSGNTNVGGLVGQNYSAGTVTNSRVYSSVKVNGEPVSASTLIGLNNGGVIENVVVDNWLNVGTFADSFAGGDGSEAAPYQIADAAQLARLAYLVNSDNATYGGSHYKLTANIDLSAHEWTPIGSFMPPQPFQGTFDGSGCTIAGLNIDVTDGSPCQGLFGYINGGTVRDVKLTGVSISANGQNVGGLVGHSNGNSTVENCSAAGVVSGNRFVGGLVGYNKNNSAVTNCSATVNCTGTFAGAGTGTGDGTGTGVGGLVGCNFNGEVTGCSATGDVNGDRDCVGGLVGINFNGTVTDCSTTGNVNGRDNIGGLVGENDNSTVQGCSAAGDVNGGKFVGGLVGGNTSSTVQGCSSAGDVNGDEFVGGFVGYNHAGTVTDSRVYSSVTVNGEPVSDSTVIGEDIDGVYDNVTVVDPPRPGGGGRPGTPSNPEDPEEPDDPGNPVNPGGSGGGDTDDNTPDGGNDDHTDSASGSSGCGVGSFGAGALILAALATPPVKKISRKRRK